MTYRINVNPMFSDWLCLLVTCNGPELLVNAKFHEGDLFRCMYLYLGKFYMLVQEEVRE